MLESRIGIGLASSMISMRGRAFLVSLLDLILSMIDGKVSQNSNETPGMRKCSICNAKPERKNKIDAILERVPSADYASTFPLYARIKFMECILKVSYNLKTPTAIRVKPRK